MNAEERRKARKNIWVYGRWACALGGLSMLAFVKADSAQLEAAFVLFVVFLLTAMGATWFGAKAFKLWGKEREARLQQLDKPEKQLTDDE